SNALRLVCYMPILTGVESVDCRRRVRQSRRENTVLINEVGHINMHLKRRVSIALAVDYSRIMIQPL
ncbi:hypothetical protein, partial [Vibrio anguillarum]|uniref:hypothetical protein n=1 Tax=Vibrio anguillarum TaxID=55601 RepID=UPI001BE40CBE